MKRLLYGFGLTVLLILGIVACSNDKAEEKEQHDSQTKEDTSSKKNDNPAEVKSESLLDWKTSKYDDSKHDKVSVEKTAITEGASDYFAKDGIFILDGNRDSKFFDYEKGKKADYDLDGKGDPWQEHDKYSRAYVFNDNYYTISDKEDSEDLQIVEIKIGTGKKKVLTSVDDVPILTKKNDNLFVITDEEIFAYDTKQEEEVWEEELNGDYAIADAKVTNKEIILFGDEGLQVFNQDDGEELYEEEGLFYDVAVDGDQFFVAEESKDTMSDFDKSRIHIQRFEAESGKHKELLTTPELNKPEDDGDLKLDVDGDMLYVKSLLGISGYDKTNPKTQWHVTIGDDLYQEITGDEPLHDAFDTAYLNGKVYVHTSDEIDEEDKELLTIIDGKTGKMKENYAFEGGTAFGPAIDDDKVVLFHLPEKGERNMYIISDDDV